MWSQVPDSPSSKQVERLARDDAVPGVKFLGLCFLVPVKPLNSRDQNPRTGPTTARLHKLGGRKDTKGLLRTANLQECGGRKLNQTATSDHKWGAGDQPRKSRDLQLPNSTNAAPGDKSRITTAKTPHKWGQEKHQQRSLKNRQLLKVWGQEDTPKLNLPISKTKSGGRELNKSVHRAGKNLGNSASWGSEKFLGGQEENVTLVLENVRAVGAQTWRNHSTTRKSRDGGKNLWGRS